MVLHVVLHMVLQPQFAWEHTASSEKERSRAHHDMYGIALTGFISSVALICHRITMKKALLPRRIFSSKPLCRPFTACRTSATLLTGC